MRWNKENDNNQEYKEGKRPGILAEDIFAEADRMVK